MQVNIKVKYIQMKIIIISEIIRIKYNRNQIKDTIKYK